MAEAAFHEIRFPEDISYGATGGPGYQTDVVTTSSGGEQRSQNWAQARCKYQAAHGVKTEEQIRSLIAFFRARKGKAYGFRYKDWADYRAQNEYIAIGDGETRIFQLQKTYADAAGYTDVRTIRKPVFGTVRVFLDGEERLDGSWAVDATTGKITFAEPVAAGAVLTASFEFDVPVRFDTDDMPLNLDSWQVYSWNNIPVVEVKI